MSTQPATAEFVETRTGASGNEWMQSLIGSSLSIHSAGNPVL